MKFLTMILTLTLSSPVFAGGVDTIFVQVAMADNDRHSTGTNSEYAQQIFLSENTTIAIDNIKYVSETPDSVFVNVNGNTDVLVEIKDVELLKTPMALDAIQKASQTSEWVKF